MKLIYVFIALVCCAPLFCQESPIEKNIKELQQKIDISQGDERLKWMDSLSNFIAFDTNFENDSIVKATVQYALELDSFNVATRQTGNLIHYQNNIKGVASEGNRMFINYLETAEKATDQRARYKFYLEGADSYYFIKDHKAAIRYYDSAAVAASRANYRKGVGIAKLYKGGSLSFTGKFPEASQILQEASAVFQQSKDTFNSISAKNSLSILYSQNDFFEEAKKERDEAIFLAKEIGSDEHLVSFYFNAATDDRKMGNDNDQITNLKLAIASNDNTRSRDVYIPTLYANLIVAYSSQDSIAQAENLLAELEKDPEKYTTGQNRAYYLESLKNLAYYKGDFNESLKYAKEHLDLKRVGTHYEELQLAEEFMAHLYEEMGNNEAAFSHFKRSAAIKDSISGVQKVKALSYYQTLYETEKRDATIKEQQNDIALLDARSKIKSQLIYFGGFGLLGLFGLVLLMRSRNAAHRRQKMQEEFSQNLIQAQEEERTRVARELHDSVGQKLMLLTKKTKEKNDPDMELLADGTLGELRSIARGLHPATMEKLGLTAAVETMINEVDANTSIFFTHEIENIDSLLSKDSSLHVYRIIQEVLNNMVKHSEAKSASVIVENEDGVIKATIQDNGIGFDFAVKMNESVSLGMKTLLERAKIIKSQLAIESVKDKGTTVSLVIPT